MSVIDISALRYIDSRYVVSIIYQQPIHLSTIYLKKLFFFVKEAEESSKKPETMRVSGFLEYVKNALFF